MKITIITLFPDMITSFLNESIMKRAQAKGAVEFEVVNLRDFALDEHGTVDDRPYGGGAGMVMRVDVVKEALKKVTSDELRVASSRVILTSAKGKTYDQSKAQELSQLDHIVIIAGHYEGFDERVLDYVDEEVSIGDFVLTGGEVPAVAVVDSIVRLLPGVLKKDIATEEESFFEVSVHDLIKACGEDETLGLLLKKDRKTVQLLEYPHYTRPEEYEGKKVPDVLLSGNHEEIRRWRMRQAYKETLKKRPDLLDRKGE